MNYNVCDFVRFFQSEIQAITESRRLEIIGDAIDGNSGNEFEGIPSTVYTFASFTHVLIFCRYFDFPCSFAASVEQMQQDVVCISM